MKRHTHYYTVETVNRFGEWTPQATFYATKGTFEPATPDQRLKASEKAFDLAYTKQDAGKKTRILSEEIIHSAGTIWEGK